MLFIIKLLLVLVALPILAIGLFISYHLLWVGRSRRASEPGFEYVYVNQNGTVRELSADEIAFLSETFSPGDSGRPYIKSHYEAVDGWGSLAGFILRRQVPDIHTIRPVSQNYRPAPFGVDELKDMHRRAGDLVVEKSDDSFTASRNPDIDTGEAYERFKRVMLERQAQDEREANT